MKYVELIKDGRNRVIKVVAITAGDLVVTDKGQLIQIINNKAVSLIPKGSWALYESPALIKRASKKNAKALFMKEMFLSPELRAVVRMEKAARTDVVRKLWNYIKREGLQDTKNRRNINSDDKLKPVFGKAVVSMFEMTALVTKHMSDKPFKVK